jgi:hypothetical protein
LEERSETEKENTLEIEKGKIIRERQDRERKRERIK